MLSRTTDCDYDGRLMRDYCCCVARALCQLSVTDFVPVTQYLTHPANASDAFDWLLNLIRCVSVKTRNSFFFLNMELLV